jgi:DNA topoisomerase-6 subunit B
MARSPRSPDRAAPQLSLMDLPPRMTAALGQARQALHKLEPTPASAHLEPKSETARPAAASAAREGGDASPREKPTLDSAENRPARRATAETMAQKQREISISEFFTKNRHLLGFDNPSKALLTTIKEAVDNSLDACEEAGILPEIEVEITDLGGGDKYRIAVEDNGPGIVKAQIPKVFGKLLYGSKFHRLKQSRGQQGIGISAAVMYGQLTTGKAARVLSRTEPKKPAHEFLIRIDTRKNAPDFEDRETKWQRPANAALAAAAPHTPGVTPDRSLLVDKEHGTRVEIEMTANFVNGQRSVLRYLEQTALANPHATVRYLRPKQPPVEFPRSTNELPVEAGEIMPHPHGIELGMLMQKLADTEEKSLTTFLQRSFSRINNKAAEEICQAAGVGVRAKPPELLPPQVEALHKALLESKIPAPPTNCLSPIGDALMRKGLISFLNVLETEGSLDQEAIAAEAQLTFDKKGRKPAPQPAQLAPKPVEAAPAAPQQAQLPGTEETPLEEGEEKIKGHRYFIATVTRPPKVYRGNPFQVEVGLAYGGTWPQDKPIELYRMANRVPLLFQRGACGVTDAVVKTPWRNYEISQPRGALPVGPMALLVHIASVWVPFTSESKEAIAHYPEILAEIKLALQECGRKLAAHLRKKKRADYEAKRRGLFELYIEEISTSLSKLTGQPRELIRQQFTTMAHEVTAGADFEKELEAAENTRLSKAPKKPAKKARDEDE